MEAGHTRRAKVFGGCSAQFFANCKPKTAKKLAYDTGMTARLWQVSANLVGLTAATQ